MNLREFARNQQSEPQEIRPAAPALPLQRQQEHEKAVTASAADAYRQYQENIRRAGGLRTDIIRGLEAGENPYKLLYLAAECIGSMTGETKVFADAVKGRITEIYGDALQVPQAAALELDDVRARLAMLRRPELKHTRNIDAAIRAHEQREKELMTLQAKADN